MKRLVIFLFIILGSFFKGYAESVSREEIHRQAVMACMRITNENFYTKDYIITPILQERDTCYFIVQFKPEGYALIAADDRVQPLIGYSVTGIFELDKAPECLQSALELRSKKIQFLKRDKSFKKHIDWEKQTLRSFNQAERIAPLIKVYWGQDYDYAKYCPTTPNGQKTLVGCVAVAMGQAMTVLRHPFRPKGHVGYGATNVGYIEIDFDEETPYNWDKILSGADKSDEVARLLYHCGVATRMQYGVKASSAYCTIAAENIISHFSYHKDSVKYYRKRSPYYTATGGIGSITITDKEWQDMIVNELKQGRAILHSLGSQRHAVNIDGYDGVNAFHFNMGWGGFNNMYYTFEKMIYDKSNEPKTWEDSLMEMIIGLVPDTRSSTDIESVAQSLETPLQVNGSLLRLKSPEKGVCRVYDLSGALLQTVPVVAGDNEILLKTKGLCILSIDCNGKVASHKIHVKE